jgi:tetratricopeptide (TPR) repeat protein
MTEATIPCPDCGRPNPPGADACQFCHFPFETTESKSASAGSAPAGAESEPVVIPRPLRPIRPRRPRPDSTSLSLWLVFGSIAVLTLLFVAIQANVERAQEPVEGSSAEQQKAADELAAILEKDSTNVDAHNALGDILYDTGNWSQAIVHYRAVLARDSSRVPAIVDLGVCYYNLGETGQAERLFELALTKDPHQPIALFNLGIVNERKERYTEALQFYHRAMQSAPPEGMKQPLMDAMQRAQEKSGRKAPPIPEAKGEGR